MNSRSKASAKYNKENTKTYLIRMNLKTDADIIRALDKQNNKTGYIKNLIAKDQIKC